MTCSSSLERDQHGSINSVAASRRVWEQPYLRRWPSLTRRGRRAIEWCASNGESYDLRSSHEL
jgi:hypothetical protein